MLDVVADPERCYRAVSSRDARFDGWFVTAVRSTRIYCRPSCPARLPRFEGVRFYAQSGGRSAGRLPGLQALPAGCQPRLAGVGHPGRSGGPGDAADR